jgi:hypothetical protein
MPAGNITEQSSKGIFAAPSSRGLSLRALNRRKAKGKLDDFAELLAEGASPAEAAVKLGHMPHYGRVLLARICKRLGPQAV